MTHFKLAAPKRHAQVTPVPQPTLGVSSDGWITTIAQAASGWVIVLTLLGLALRADEPAMPTAANITLPVPQLVAPVVIDGDLADWRDLAWNDGAWDLRRVEQASWYDAGRINRLTVHGDEPRVEDDLSARYFVAWDDRYLYLGAEVHDNVNDVNDPKHEPKRWYYRDAIAWFMEAPRDGRAEKFGEGDHGFAFTIDAKKPEYGAWWRHGTSTQTYVEEAMPKRAVDYVIRFNPWGRGAGDFVLEARIELSATLGRSERGWAAPKTGDVYSLCIVHTDPDGGDYGGHLLMYGTGDDDSTWARAVLSGPRVTPERKTR